jgi:viroplasmin and RNaseH domain-containing protein
MWIRKKGIEEDIADAKQQGNETQCQPLMVQLDALNRDMFAALHRSQTSGNDDGSSSNTHDPAPDSVITYYGIRRGNSVGVCDSWAELQSRISGYLNPTFQSFQTWQEAKDYVIEGMWNDMPDASRRFATPPSKRGRRPDNKGPPPSPPVSNDPTSCESDARSSFGIWLAYWDEEFPHVVWHDMPVARLVDAAGRILRQNGEDIREDQIVLMHDNRVMDATFGRLSDHNVESEDRIEILVSTSDLFTHSRRIVSNPKPTHPDPQSIYYAVREGRVPGIFRTWEECKLQVEGYPNCEFKSFKLERDALNYVSLHRNKAETPTNRQVGETRHDLVRNSSRSQDKIKQTFKCPRFSGNAKDWKAWNKGFQRYLSIWDLGYVLQPDFFDDLPLSEERVNDNKLVYFLLEDATQASPLAASYHRQAPLHNGFEAYYTLHDGFVFAAATASTILLNELSNFRFQQDETPTALIMRLEELIQDMKMLPEGAAMTFTDTQRIGYLLGALRHEPEWKTVASAITSSQLKGDITFRQACGELRVRCEAERAYDIIDKGVKSKRRILATSVEPLLDDTAIEGISTALVSSVSKRLNKEVTGAPSTRANKKRFPCLAKGCAATSPFSLCGLHYHSVVSGKSPELELINDYGRAVFNVTTNLIDYPSKVPKDRLPSNKTKQ